MMDDIDRRMIGVLAANARVSLKTLAQEAGMSAPSTAERLRRLEERGVVGGYTITIPPRALGYEMQAIVRIRPLPGMLATIEKLIRETPEIVECDKVTGDDCFIARLFIRSMEHLDEVIDMISAKAETSSAMVKSQPVKRRLPRF